MKKIAITGGICSGKSYICNIIEKMGYNVFYSDAVANDLANTNISLIYEITREFGAESYSNYDGSYNKKYIAGLVFNNAENLDKLNKIFVKYITSAFDYFCEIHSDEEIIFCESALIYEHNKQGEFDYVIVVSCSKNIVIERLRSRNNFNDEEIENRLKSQLDPDLKIKQADYVIDTTNGNVEEQITSTINKLKNERQ